MRQFAFFKLMEQQSVARKSYLQTKVPDIFPVKSKNWCVPSFQTKSGQTEVRLEFVSLVRSSSPKLIFQFALAGKKNHVNV